SFTPAQKGQVAELLQRHNGGPSFGVVLLDLQGELERLKASLASLSQPHQTYTRIQSIVLTVSDAASSDAATQVIQVTADNWLAQLNGLLSTAGFDWFMVVAAGDEFTANGLLVTALDLISAPGCRAVYTDEMMRQESGKLGVLLRPDLNLDLLLSLPASMARHWLFRRDLWVEMGGFAEQFNQAF